MFEKISHFIFGLAVFMSIVAGMTCFFAYHGRQMNQYAIEHNCVWKYNGMCYSVDSWEAKHLA